MFKKFAVITFILLSVFCLSSCGGRKISDEEISAYLYSEYFSSRNMSLLKLSNVTEEPGETKNKVTLTCTTLATNEYAEQTSNWTMNFELFDKEWIGTGLFQDYSEYYLTTDLSEDDFAKIAFKGYNPDIDTEYHIYEVKTDLESGTATARFCLRRDYRSYSICQEHIKTSQWDPNSMSWQCNEISEFVGDEEVIVTSDISGHYEGEVDGIGFGGTDYTETFDIIKDTNSNGYFLQNYCCKSKPGSFFVFEYTADDLPINFYLSSGFNPKPQADLEIESHEIKFILDNDKLYYVGPRSVTKNIVHTDLEQGEFPTPDGPQIWHKIGSFS